MKTTIAICILALCWPSLGLETLLVGDFISEPAPDRVNGWNAQTTYDVLSDGAQDQNWFTAAMGANGNGLIPKFIDLATRKETGGTLILKNPGGSYRTLDLPFNCSSYDRIAATNGQMFLCGNKIFSLGPNDSINDVQDITEGSFNYGVFASNNIFLSIGVGSYNVYANLSGSWALQSSKYYPTTVSPRLSANIAANLKISLGLIYITLFERSADALNWTVAEVLTLNRTDIFDSDIAVWDGANTIIVGWNFQRTGINKMGGDIKIFRKQNGAWGLHKVITSKDLDLPAPGGLGVGLYLLDANTFIVHAAAGNRRNKYLTGGMAFALEKIANDWVITKKFVQQNNDAYLVGAISYDKSDGRLYFSACSTRVTEGRRYYRVCGIKYAVWDRSE